MSHKAEGTEYIFRFFSVKSQIEGFLYCLSPSICNQKISKTERKRGRGGEVGWSIIARSERNLCVWSMALCMSACQPGNFSSVCMKTCVFFSVHSVEGKCGCLADNLENWHLWLCSNPFCLYLLTSIPKHQLEGLTVVTHAMFDVIVLVSHHATGGYNNAPWHSISDTLHKYNEQLEAFY